MKIAKGKAKGVVVTLGKSDTKKWEDPTERGALFRRRTMAEARIFARTRGVRGNIEVYAAKSAGGWTADVEAID
jgi:hypothetical protein